MVLQPRGMLSRTATINIVTNKPEAALQNGAAPRVTGMICYYH